MSVDNSTHYGSYRSRPAWREYNTRRFQNKMESLSLQEQQSELRLRAAEMAQEQKIKNLNDRLNCQDQAVELMRQRHMNQTRDLRNLQGRRLSSSHYDNVTRGAKKVVTDNTCPIAELRRFTKIMDDRYEKLTERRCTNRLMRTNSEQPAGYAGYLPDPLSYRSVKDMLNHLPITPIFKETTCSLSGLQSHAISSNKQAKGYEDALLKLKSDGTGTYASSAIRMPNGSVNLFVRRQRDVAVPMKDVTPNSLLENMQTPRRSSETFRRSDKGMMEYNGSRLVSTRRESIDDSKQRDNIIRPGLNEYSNVTSGLINELKQILALNL